ncbi:FIGNL1-interacting regulator of recombination and mitosis-like isoform X2 [Saccostrea echinata]|uniref:FIGNL1-interacting regulator of recombination and mitosis-like isoform X2 n=1 Tax=Saccostrea echinata TaxID=191078 RepID=UPI002A8174B2|nr:FIGNL1-interacting regulator of recombination and mitosis-like isoform X2 [Saccostrea echinata]
MSQSQSSFLETVVSWDGTQCQDNLDTALPRLIRCFQEVNIVQEQIGILKIICHSFLPCVEAIQAEEKLFSKLIDEVCGVFDKALDDIHQYTQSTDKKSSIPGINTSLQILLDLLEFLETCIYHMQNGNVALDWSHIHSLPRGTIHFLKGAYGHCKDSGDVYQDLLSSMSAPLSSLFKKTHSLQVAFLRLLDNIKLSDPVTEQDVLDLTQVCRGLFDVCQIVTSLDMKLMVTLWKAISKHAINNKVHVGQRLEVGGMIGHLCGEIQSGFLFLLQLIPQVDPEGAVLSQGDEKGFQKSLKILGFQMKILVMLVREFSDVVHGCEELVYSLLLTLMRLLPPSLSAQQIDEKHLRDIRQHLTNAIDILIKALISNRAFTEAVTGAEKVRSLTDGDSFPHLQTVLKVLEFLPQMPDDVQDQWVDPKLHPEDEDRLSVIDVVFKTTSKCSKELNLPIVLTDSMLSAKPEREVILYEVCCTRLCAFLGSLSAKHFLRAEGILFENALSHDFWCHLLAEDIWCFIIRYGSADLCRDHVTFLLEVMKQCWSFDLESPLLSLVVRLIKCLSSEHQTELIRRLSSEEDLSLLYVLSCCLPSFSDENNQNLVEKVSEKCSKILQEFTVASEKTQQDFYRMLNSVSCLCELMNNNDTIGLAVQSAMTMSLTDSVSQVWREMFISDWTDSSLLELCLQRLVLLSSHLSTLMENDVLLKILSVMSFLLLQGCSSHLHLTIVCFLKSFGKIRLTATPEPQILKKFSDLFVMTLTSPDLFIHHHGLSAFTQFAENTIHESVVPDCIDQQPQLQDFVVQFLSKIPHTCEELSRLEFLRMEPPPDSNVNRERNDTIKTKNEPSSKRPRLMDNDSKITTKLGMQVKELVVVLRQTLSELENLNNTEDCNLSSHSWNNLETIHCKITGILKEKG